MPDVILPASFLAVIRQLRFVFTKPSFANFAVLVSGFVFALGGHRLTDALRAVGRGAPKHYSAYYRFFSKARWSLDELGLRLAGIIIRTFDADVVELVLDDTLTRRTGKKVALASMHADPLLKKASRGRLFVSYGHVFVVLAIHVKVPKLGNTGWALPVLFRLYRGPSHGGRDDAPSDKRRKLERRQRGAPTRERVRLTDVEVVGDKDAQQLCRCAPKADIDDIPEVLRRKKTDLGAELVVLMANRFPDQQFRVLADHLYNGKSVIHAVHEAVDNTHVVTRGRPDAALYDLPPAQREKRPGRPKKKGKRLLNPRNWAAAHPEAFESVAVEMYGRLVTVELASYVGIPYRSLPGRLVRYVIVRDPDGIYREDYIFSTNINLTPAEIIAAYSRRWPLERTFQDCKQKLQVQNTQLQLPASVRRSVPFGMLVYSLVVYWYITVGHVEAATLNPHPDDPWYRRTGRPSFTDMLAALRRLGWARRFVDLPSTTPSEPKFWQEYLARMVAAA